MFPVHHACFALPMLSVLAIGRMVFAADAELPRLQKNHGAWQLMVDGKPFLMRGGEFSNNVYESPKDLQYLEMMLDAYKVYDLNTLLVPISWRSLEPKEGQFDLRMIDNLIEQCRKRDLRVIVLWFGAVKNGGLHYAPRWVVDNHDRFFRAKRANGKDVYAVSPFCEAAWQADIIAFRKLMERIKARDAAHTVIMIQPENETGCQEIDQERDHSDPANRTWAGNVPDDLIQYMAKHDGELVAWLAKVGQRNGKKAAGTWPEVFGADVDGQKIFMAYYMARFVERVAAAGMAVHPLPMFVNDWLGGIDSPGGPIGGPDFQVMDVWRVACPTAQAFAADIYQDNFKAWLAAYHQLDNPILIPEARNDARNAQQCWYTYFQHNGLLYSPYLLVPREAEQKQVPTCLSWTNLNISYGLIKEMDQIILSKQGLNPREMVCFELDKNERVEKAFQAEFQGFKLTAKATRGYGKLTEGEQQETPAFAAILKMGENDFVVIGKTMRVEFAKAGAEVKSIERGTFKANQWVGQGTADGEKASGKLGLQLTEAPESIDVIRVRMESK